MTDPEDSAADAKPEGWSTGRTLCPVRPFKFYRDELEPLLESLPFDGPTASRDGAKINREAWDPETRWKVGLQEDSDERGPRFRALAENGSKNVRVFIPVRLVDLIRKRICPAAAGRSE